MIKMDYFLKIINKMFMNYFVKVDISNKNHNFLLL